MAIYPVPCAYCGGLLHSKYVDKNVSRRDPFADEVIKALQLSCWKCQYTFKSASDTGEYATFSVKELLSGIENRVEKNTVLVDKEFFEENAKLVMGLTTKYDVIVQDFDKNTIFHLKRQNG